MYLFVYKTVHKNGKYYICRHQTNNLNDGYLGSGKWIKGIKDKTDLSREIIKEASNIDELKNLEEYYINLYWDDPLCMNFLKSSCGFSSFDAKERTKKLIENGTHNFLKQENGDSIGNRITQKRIKEKTHNFLKQEDGTSIGKTNCLKQLDEGTHPFMKKLDGYSISSYRVKNKTHQFLKRQDGTSISSDMVKNGTHNFLKKPDGNSIQTERVKNGSHNLLGPETNAKRIKNGTHNFLKNKNSIACYNKNGNYVRIPKEQYHSQSGPMEDWEWVTLTSKEGKSRKNKI